MNLPTIALLLLGALTAVAGVGVVAARNVLHAALALVATLMGVAGIFILLGAEFVGLVQVLVYVGAVVVLFLFGIMLTAARPVGTRPVVDNNQRWMAAAVAFGVFSVLAAGMWAAFHGQTLELKHAFPTTELGLALFTEWILPFEVVSILLLAALIGAIVLARKD